MYAVIKTGGKQYRVKKGDCLKIEKIEAEVGDKVVFDEVLMLSDGDTVEIGKPNVEKASVAATVTEQSKAKKIIIIKFRRRKHSMKRQGHRQLVTTVSIDDISLSGKTAAKESAKAPAKTKTTEKAAKADANVTAAKPTVKKTTAKPKAASKTAPKADVKAKPVAKKTTTKAAETKKTAAKKVTKSASKDSKTSK